LRIGGLVLGLVLAQVLGGLGRIARRRRVVGVGLLGVGRRPGVVGLGLVEAVVGLAALGRLDRVALGGIGVDGGDLLIALTGGLVVGLLAVEVGLLVLLLLLRADVGVRAFGLAVGQGAGAVGLGLAGGVLDALLGVGVLA